MPVKQNLGQTIGAVLLATSGLLILAAKFARRFMPAQAKAMDYQSFTAPVYTTLAISGEEESSSSQDWRLSRRGMGPLLTGALLSPTLVAQAAEQLTTSVSGAAMAATAPAMELPIVIPSPKEWIAQNLEGSLPSKEYVRLTAQILSRQGLNPSNTVPCVGVCRDEMCQPIVDEIEAEWGDAFNMTSLGGMLTLGKTGLQAAMAHSPVDDNGREHYFFLAFPHISIDTAGVGRCTRPGRNKPSKACGALAAFTNELSKGNVSTEADPLDPEYSYMKVALLDLIPPSSTPPDLLEVTKVAAQASLDQLEQLVAATVDPKKADYAICVGVLVHEQDLRPRDAKIVGPQRQYVDQVYPTAFYSVVNGRKKDLIWRLDRD